MPKTLRNVFYKKLTFDNILAAHHRASINKRGNPEVIRYEMDLESNVHNLINEIKNHKYEISKYREFIIYEPKRRTIRSLPYKDRIVHQWYVEEFLKPYVCPRFISDSYACIEGKGHHKAVKRLQNLMRVVKRKLGKYYILKCDVKKFFYNIDKRILCDILKKYILDKELFLFTELLLYSGDNEPVGLPIGNYTSQYFANIYLNELDKYLKNDLHIKYYIRYMDDFILMVETKEQAKSLKALISSFLNEKLRLELNEKSTYFPNELGVNFCGYKVFETHMLLKRASKLKIKKNISIWNKLYSLNKLDSQKMLLSWNSWVAHSKHANAYTFRVKMHTAIKNNTILDKQ